MTDVALILGFDGLGGVAKLITYAKSCALIPFVVVNAGGAKYSDVLPSSHLIRSRHVNSDCQALSEEIQRRLDGVLGHGGWRVAVLANLQDRMWLTYLHLLQKWKGARGISATAISSATVKPNLRNALSSTDLHVKYAVLRFPSRGSVVVQEGDARLLECRLPVIVKPAVGMAGQGVFLAKDADQLKRSCEKVVSLQKRLYSSRISLHLRNSVEALPVNELVLVEEYLDGTELSIEGLADFHGNVTILSTQVKTRQEQEPVFRDLQYTASIPTVDKNVLLFVRRVVRAARLRGMPFHLEAKRTTAGTYKPIELNPRPGGGSISDLVLCTSGVDVFAEAARCMFPMISKRRTLATSVIQPKPGVVGVVRSYIGLSRLKRLPECVFVRILSPIGTRITEADREVYLVEFCVSASSARQAVLLADRLATTVRVVIE